MLLSEGALKQLFGKVSLINFFSTWTKIPMHCIFADVLLMEGQVQGALQKELLIAPFLERFQRATLGKSHR